jgi:hypothetical protein
VRSLDFPKFGMQALCKQLCDDTLPNITAQRLNQRSTFVYNQLLTELLEQCGDCSAKLLDTVEAVRDRLPDLAKRLPPLLQRQCDTGAFVDEARLCQHLTPHKRQKMKPGDASKRSLREWLEVAQQLVQWCKIPTNNRETVEDSSEEEEEEDDESKDKKATSSSSSSSEEEEPKKKVSSAVAATPKRTRKEGKAIDRKKPQKKRKTKE